MIDSLANFLFENVFILLVISVIALVIWIYLYIIEYSKELKKIKAPDIKMPNINIPGIELPKFKGIDFKFSSKPKKFTRENLIDYFRIRVSYLMENIDKLSSREAIIEMDMIARYYLAVHKNIRISPGDTVSEIADRINKKDHSSNKLIHLLIRFRTLKHKLEKIDSEKIKLTTESS